LLLSRTGPIVDVFEVNGQWQGRTQKEQRSCSTSEGGEATMRPTGKHHQAALIWMEERQEDR